MLSREPSISANESKVGTETSMKMTVLSSKDGGNYLVWKMEIDAHLSARNLDGIVFGRHKKPKKPIKVLWDLMDKKSKNAFRRKRAQFKVKQLQAWLMLLKAVGPEYLSFISPYSAKKDVHGAWCAILANFNEDKSILNEFSALRALQHVKMEVKPGVPVLMCFQNFVAEIERLVSQLAQFGCKVEEKNKLLYLMDGMPDAYKAFNQLLMLRLENMSFQGAVTAISNNIKQMQAGISNGIIGTNVITPTPAPTVPLDGNNSEPSSAVVDMLANTVNTIIDKHMQRFEKRWLSDDAQNGDCEEKE